MKNLLFAIAFLLTLSLNAQDWVTVKDIDLGYRLDFPTTATKDNKDVPTAKGNVVMHTYTAYPAAGDDNILYMSSFSEYPESFFPEGLKTQEQIDTVLEGAVNGAVTNVNGTLLSKKDIVFNGYPGRHFKIEVDQAGSTYILTMWNILVDYRMYIVQTIALKGSEENDNFKKFLDSFELIKVKN
ncbi:MAG: hypothetical protein ED556_08325 [Winogradskyella sp.]|uniref:hypothetical protein n=1 Tax=Winogradskyella sp. TaxID=1883156 RepID=UPI000F41CA47|nr:hypothetical protein [Winogradskyella sp.]RNC86290.1 MAG: hypothetical protein ED556_08325 [Winogradskyella sp.]